MNRKASSLTSPGISTALIATLIRLLYYLPATLRDRFDGWQFPQRHHGIMVGVAWG